MKRKNLNTIENTRHFSQIDESEETQLYYVNNSISVNRNSKEYGSESQNKRKMTKKE